MKKALKMLLVSLVVAAVSSVALAADAETSIGAWGRAVFTPAMSNDEGETVGRDGVSWGDAVRTGITVSGNSDNVGFQIDINADGGSVSCGDQQKIWVKPMDIMKLSFGHNAYYDTLRGNSAYGAWDWLRFSSMTGEDDIFARAVATDGMLFEVATSGIHVFAALDTQDSDSILGDDPSTEDEVETDFETGTKPYTTAKMFARGQYGAGYEIAGVGMVRAQYTGVGYQDGDDYSSYGVINAAVKIDQMVQGLYVDLGVFYPTDADQDNTKIAAKESYTMGAIKLNLVQAVELEKMNSVSGSEETAMEFGVGVDFDLGDGLGIVSDFRYMNEADTGTKDGGIGVLVGLAKGYSNGKIGAGIEVCTDNFANGGAKDSVDDTAWTIPVVAEYWF